MLVLTSCWNSGNHPSVGFRTADLIGTWSAPAVAASSPSITFSEDGTYVATGFPDGLLCSPLGEEPNYDKPVSSSGEWTIDPPARDRHHVEIRWPADSGDCFEALWTEELDDELHLFVWIGDPDEDNTITFSRP